MTLQELVSKAHGNAKDKGFWMVRRNVGELLMLTVTELAEALEAHRNGRAADVKRFDFNVNVLDKSSLTPDVKGAIFEDTIKDTFEDEIADAFIRLADLCGGLGIDIERYIELKMEYNRTRPIRHGKQY